GEPGRLDESGVKELSEAGMTIGSHGWAHRDWRGLTPTQARAEFVEAPRMLSGITGQPVTQAAIPFGSYDRHVLRWLRQAKVSQALTSDGGRTREGAWLQARNSLRHTVDAEWIRRVILGTPSLPLRARHLVARGVKRMRG
ncbi:MAG: hypothetical protein QOE51_982, partial [Actinoplanes sp.]|nr:hypothetical protein [Actinoplanes sp.]